MATARELQRKAELESVILRQQLEDAAARTAERTAAEGNLLAATRETMAAELGRTSHLRSIYLCKRYIYIHEVIGRVFVHSRLG